MSLTACTPAATPALVCQAPVETDLGRPTIDVPAWFTLTEGRARFAISDTSLENTIASDLDVSTVYVGGATTVPTVRPAEGGRIVNSRYAVEVDPEHPGTADLAAGSYWLVSPTGRITLAVCPGTTVSGVLPGPGATVTTTPSPTPSDP